MSTGYPTDLILGIQGHQDTVHTISTITNLVSIICTSMVLLFLIAAQMLNGQLVKPMTVRLTIAIACTLWALSFVRLLYPTVSHDAISCQKIMITIIWFNNQYVFFSMALEMSIFCNLFSKEALSSSIEKWFYMTPVLLAFLTALFTAMFEVVGYNQDREACWYNVSATTWEYATLIAPQMLGVVSTFLGAFFLMILKVCRRHQAKLY
ncbi:uncharacterized protein BYT42DRAFT_563046, partial [Radiomyces spectabilis]|uniref:uncharacterized protein n=1 Tax=Radiomyces spectabilis TaxID=64574 RepID=UPI00221E9C81